MKAILVIDIPETIRTEYLNKDLIVQLWDKDDEHYIMHDICPLKPLPDKIDQGYPCGVYDEGYGDGWDACIDEILGETND